jgi:hypothetical protein
MHIKTPGTSQQKRPLQRPGGKWKYIIKIMAVKMWVGFNLLRTREGDDLRVFHNNRKILAKLSN